MSNNIVEITNNKLVMKADTVLEESKGTFKGEVIVLGWDEDGELVMHSTMTKKSDLSWLLINAHKVVMDV